jgi:hypothetical protein
MGLSEEQIEEMRKRLKDREEPAGKQFRPNSPHQKQRKPSRGPIRTFLLSVMWTLQLYFIFAIWYNANQDYEDRLNFSNPVLVFDEIVLFRLGEDPLREFTSMKEANDWCLDNTDSYTILRVYDDLINQFSEHDQPVLKEYTCSRLIDHVAGFKTDEEWDRRYESLVREYIPKLAERLSKFSPVISCDIRLETNPVFGEKIIWDYEVARVEKWKEKEFERLDTCIKSAVFDHYDEAYQFLDEAFLEVLKPIATAAFIRFRDAAERIDAFNTPLSFLYDEIQITASEQHAKNINKWQTYGQTTLKPARQEGRTMEREIAKEEADKAYEEEHGYMPGQMCVYDDGKRRRQMLCVDMPTGGSTWEDELSDIFGGINRDMQRRQEEKNRRILQEQTAYLNALMLYSKTVEADKSTSGNTPHTQNNIKKSNISPSCNVHPALGEFKSCLFVEKCTPNPPLTTCVKRDRTAEAQCHAAQKAQARINMQSHVDEYAKNENCQAEARRAQDRLDGNYKGHSGSSRGISK